MKFNKLSLLVSVSIMASTLTGCASMVMGTTQQVTVNVTPETASCDFVNKAGVSVASVTGASKTATVPKSGDDLTLKCSAKGLTAKTVNVKSSLHPGAVLIAGAGDIGTGAVYKYPSTVDVDLTK